MVAVVSGIGPGLGASLCHKLHAHGIPVAGLARSDKAGRQLQRDFKDKAPSFRFYTCDLRDEEAVHGAMNTIRDELGAITTSIYNAGAVTIAPFLETTTQEHKLIWETNYLGAVNTAKAVLPDMLKREHGTLLFTGATAALRGSAKFSAFAGSKFALRGLAQSLAREFGPQGIHVSHVIVDGLIWGPVAVERFGANKEHCLNPDKIADQYINLIQQDRSAWTQELDLRPYSENF